MEIVDSAVRTVKRSEIAAEFYSYPQKYILGMDENAEQMDKWRATMSSMLRIDKDEDGDKPSVGQFQMAAQTPHTEQLRGFAGLFAGETGLTLDDLGFPSQNPSSSEAIKAAHESLRLTARKAQKTFGTGLLNAGYLAACVRDHVPYHRRQLYRTRVLWDPLFEPDLSSLSGVGDAVQKIQTSFPEYFTESKLKELTCRKLSGTVTGKIKKINQVIRGWINYYALGSMKTVMAEIDAHLRTRLRIIIWKQWKVPKKRQWGLQKLGIDKDRARQTSYCGNRYYWVCTQTCVVRAISKVVLSTPRLVSCLDYYNGRHALKLF
jgi:hypothetical protein